MLISIWFRFVFIYCIVFHMLHWFMFHFLESSSVFRTKVMTLCCCCCLYHMLIRATSQNTKKDEDSSERELVSIFSFCELQFQPCGDGWMHCGSLEILTIYSICIFFVLMNIIYVTLTCICLIIALFWSRIILRIKTERYVAYSSWHVTSISRLDGCNGTPQNIVHKIIFIISVNFLYIII